MGRNLPSGTVTFLFTDVEGSTRLLNDLGAERYADALAEHRRLLRQAFTAHGGVEVDTQGDAFFFAFSTAPGALAAAAAASEALTAGPISVRMGLHTGTPHLTAEGYVGADIHRAARIAASGHGGQILVSAATAALVDRAELRDLGAHRLKDLSAPERIYQLGREQHPPLKTLHQTNLPVIASSFVGREREVAAVTALLARDEIRLLTLTGPGGTGKTRLALQAGASAADAFPGGVWWVGLAPLRDPELVLESAGKALGASGDLAEHIGDSRLLLLLDNFEQVIEAAGGVAQLLAACPNLTLLVTSREPLHLAGEREYAVDPLEPAEAVDLFLTRAVAARRDFVSNGEVAAICERLDHLPLAIELAAARVKVLSPTALLQRLEQRLPVLAGGSRDAPDRQRTLRATIAWSHELLGTQEQRLFARLAVFRGGCTLESAESVADADLDTLQSLVDKNLLRVREDRFWMLETIREFALEQLVASGESDTLRRRHASHFLALAEAADHGVGTLEKEALDALEREHDNLRAAFDAFEAAADHVHYARLAGALARFWYSRGHLPEARRRLGRAIALEPDSTAARARALNGATLVGVEAGGDLMAPTRYAEEALAIYRGLGDARGVAYSVLMLAGSFTDRQEWTTAQRYFEESRARFTELGDENHVLLATRLLAWTHFEQGDLSGARAMHEENLVRARALRNDRIVGTTLGALGEYDIREGNVDAALPKLFEAYEISRGLVHPLEIAAGLCRFAWALAVRSRSEPAAQVLARSLRIYEELGVDVPAWVKPMNDEVIAIIRRSLDDAALARESEKGRALTVDEAVGLARDLQAARAPQ